MLGRVAGQIDNVMSNVGSLITEFEQETASGYFANEEDITSQFARALKTVFTVSERDFSIDSRAIVTKKTSEEPTIGADILVVASFDSPELSVSKGFLAQAKLVNLGKSIGGAGPMNVLRDQCTKMLNYTPESYVWLYSKESFRVQRAVTTKAITTNRPGDAISYPFYWFFYDFLNSMRGDPSINLQDFSRLQGLVEELRIPFVLLISAKSSGGDRPRGAGAPPSPDEGPPDLDVFVRRLEGTPIEEWYLRESEWGYCESATEEANTSEQAEQPDQSRPLSEC